MTISERDIGYPQFGIFDPTADNASAIDWQAASTLGLGLTPSPLSPSKTTVKIGVGKSVCGLRPRLVLAMLLGSCDDVPT